MTQVTTLSRFAVKRRSVRRRVVRILAAVMAALALAYALLPVWLPTGWIARKLVDQLSAALTRKVGVGRVSLSWRDGVVFENVTIADEPGASNPLLARVGQVRCAFSPILMLLSGRIEQVEIIDPQVWLVFDDQGTLRNMPELLGERRGRLPAYRHVVRGVVCHVLMPEARQTFRVDRLECSLEPATGQLRLVSSTVVTHSEPRPKLPSLGKITLEADLTVPQLKRDEKLEGTARVEWTDLALSDLPLPIVSRLPIEQVDGVTSGALAVKIYPHLGLDFDLFIEFNGVRIVARGDQRPAQIPDATIRCGGRLDPTVEEVVFEEFAYETPALHLYRPPGLTGPPLTFERGGEVPFQVRLAGRVKDWVKLRREFPELEVLARRTGADFAGSAEFTLALLRRGAEDQLALSVDGRDSRWVLRGQPADYLSADAGVPKTIAFEMTRNRRSGLVSQPHLTMSVGDLAVVARHEFVAPAGEPPWTTREIINALRTLRAEVTIHSPRAEDLPIHFPILAQVADVAGWRGAVRMQASVEPVGDASQFGLAVEMDPETCLAIGDWFDKSPGEPLRVHARGSVPHGLTGEVDDLQFEVAHGKSRLGLAFGPGQAPVRYRFEDAGREDPTHRGAALEASWTLPLSVDGVEGVLSLCPRWRAWRAAHPGRELTGDAGMSLHGWWSYRPRDWVLHHEFLVDADRLAVRWDDLVRKAAAEPAALALAHRWQGLGDRREHSFSAALRSSAGEVRGTLAWAPAGTDEPRDDFEHATVSADLQNVAEALALMPALANRFSSIDPRGALAVELDYLAVAGTRTLRIMGDATGAGFALPGDPPVRKPPGTEVVVSLEFEAAPADPGRQEQTWTLTSGQARLGALNVAELSGQLVMAEPRETPPSRELGEQPAAPVPTWQSFALHLRGDLGLDESLAEMHPQLRRWREQFALWGQLEWDVQVQASGGVLATAGRLDATQGTWAVTTGDSLAPTFHKPLDVPLSLSFGLTAREGHGGQAWDLDITSLDVDLDGNALALRGRLALGRDADGVPRLDDAALSVDLCLEHPERVGALLPAALIDPLAGQCAASFELRRSGPRWRCERGRVDLGALAIGLAGDPVTLDGTLTVDGDRVLPEQICWTWGNSRGVVSGYAGSQDDGWDARIGLAAERLDVADLFRRIYALPASIATQGRDAPGGGPSGAYRALVDALARTRLQLDVNLDELLVELPMNVRATADAVSKQGEIRDGRATLTFRGLMDGGVVEGSVESDLRDPDLTYYLKYTADRLQPGQVVDRYLSLSFPGMRASGPLTLIDETTQRLFPAPGEANYEAGQGELIIEGGSIEGRAAPLWVTRVFPGLNLAKFNFAYMHSWFTKMPDGRVRHQMIYQGAIYNIYMVGYSDADLHFEYEVGIDFLANFDSHYWAETGQGRIPLFTKTGRVAQDGTLLDERVQYVPEEFMLSLIWKNNPVVTAYLAIRQQVLGKP